MKGVMTGDQQSNQLLSGKAAVIYGGSGAIGAAVARVFVREGASVFLVGRTQQRLDKIAGDLAAAGGKVEIATLDVFDENAVTEHAREAAAKAGGIDVVVNATSTVHDQGTELSGLSQDAFMLPIDSFMRPLFITSKAVAPHIGTRRQGVILNLTAPAAKMTVPGHLGHIVSCAAIEAFSRALAGELAPQNVRVLAVRPHAIADAPEAGSYTGAVFAPKAAAAGISVAQWLEGAAATTMLKRLPTLAEVAETIGFLASDRASSMTAAVANLTAGAVVE
jgi:NAD(P)-dependent dehydrogenase (short-subunit alcohol dehydrogenase family)